MVKVLCALLMLSLSLGFAASSVDICENQLNGIRLAHPVDCTKFVVCQNGKSDHFLSCPLGLQFNRFEGVCDFRENAACEKDFVRGRLRDADDCSACCAVCGCGDTPATLGTPECGTPSIPVTPTTPGTPATPSPGTPATPSPETPATPTPGPPATPTPETPATPSPETPATPTPETPATPTPGQPATPSPETPATPSPETPATPSPETPATPTPEIPATPTPETPETPTPETPATPTPETPETPTPETPATPTPETPATPTPGTPGPPGNCSNDLTVCADRADGSNAYVNGTCNQYVVCVGGCSIIMNCPNNLLYNLLTKVCDNPQNVDCPWPSTPPSTGPSGTTCEQPGKCLGKSDGTIFANPNSNGYIVCQCECEIQRPCPGGTAFNEKQQTCAHINGGSKSDNSIY